MKTRSSATAVVLVLGSWVGLASAGDVTGKVKSVDVKNQTVTLEVNSAERVFSIPSEAKVVGSFGKKEKKATTEPIEGGLKGLKEGSELTITTELRDDKEVVLQVKVAGLQAKVKKAKKAKKKTA
jgi:Cu/Ag efflux protein CusF